MNYYNQMYQNPFQPQFNRMQQPMQSYQPMQSIQPIQQVPNLGLQGKSVDSLDVVKAMDIPLDGSISYFPLTNGTAIVTKQLQADGTSKTIVYEPVDADKIKDIPKYVTTEDLDTALKKVDNSSLKDEIKSIKRQIKDLSNDLEDVRERKE